MGIYIDSRRRRENFGKYVQMYGDIYRFCSAGEKKSKRMGIYIDGDIYRFAPQNGNFRKKWGYISIYIPIHPCMRKITLAVVIKLSDTRPPSRSFLASPVS